MKLEDKLDKLREIISGYGSCLIAFSGGLDSSFLLKAASLSLPKEKIIAVTADSLIYKKEELIFAKNIAKGLGVKHKIIKTHVLRDKRFIPNSLKRCYYCKLKLFKKLKKIASKYKLRYVLDGSNLSDKLDFRPGDIARKTLQIRSPLAQAGLTKDDIRKLSKRLGLFTWDKPSLACLVSRIPYGMRISARILDRINRAEAYLNSLGFRQVRLRHYNGLCRIEVFKQDIPALIEKRNKIISKLKRLGYDHITVDLEGYRTGSMNPDFSAKIINRERGGIPISPRK